MTATPGPDLDQMRQALTADGRRGATSLKVECDLRELYAVEVTAGRHFIEVDEPRAFGGAGTAPNPAGYALAALGSCEAIGFRIWSELLGVPFDSVRVVVEGDIDLRGALGVGEGVRPGFTEVRMTVTITGGEPADRYEQLAEAVKAHSPLLDTFERPIPVTATLEVS